MTISAFTPPGEEYNDLLSSVGADLGARGLIDVANVSTRPRPGVRSAEELMGVFNDWFKERRQQQGGRALDEAYAPADATYAERRYKVIAESEGVREGVYRDTRGIRTVGVGFNMDQPAARSMWRAAGLDDAKFDAVREGRVRMTPAEVRQLADSTIESFEKQVADKFRGVDLTEGQRLTLVSLAFNGGIGLVGPRLTAAVREGRTADAVNEILYHSGTAVEPRLAARRYREAQMFVGALDAPSVLPAFASYRANPVQRPA